MSENKEIWTLEEDLNDSYCVYRIYCNKELKFNLHNCERWRSLNELAIAKAFGSRLVALLNNESAEIEKYKIALADAVRRPMGVLPKSAEGLIDDEDVRAAEARRTDKPMLDLPCNDCGKIVGKDYVDYEEFVICGECDSKENEAWNEFERARLNNEI